MTAPEDTTLYIHTYRRVDAQHTWAEIEGSEWAERTVLVVAEDEEVKHRERGRPTLVCPSQGRLAVVRQWLFDNCPTRYAIFLDDDLTFGRRRYDDPGKFTGLLEGDIDLIFDRLRTMLNQTRMVGLDARSGGNRSPVPTATGRFFGVLGFDLDVVKEHGIRFDRVVVMEDFDVHLQFLRLGYPTAKLTTHYKGDVGGSNSDGGCSEYRDASVQTDSANGLKSLHPDFVTVVEKETKSWGGGLTTRTDVRVGWAKALKAGREMRDILGEDQEPEPDWTGLAPDWEIF